MFSDKIVASDAFLDMPLSAQALYFHLCMNADNDGFVQPKKIMRMVNAANDDLQILIAKRFILVFDSGVAVIKHWWINNTKRGDRHVQTTYQNELAELHQKSNKAYARITTQLELETDDGNQPTTVRQPNGNQMATQYNTIQSNTTHVQYNSTQDKATQSTRAVGKPTARPERVPTSDIDEMLDYWQTTVQLQLGNEMGQRKAIAAMLRQPKMDKDKLKQLIAGVALALDDQYAPRISDFVSLKRKQNDLLVWGRKRGNNGQRSVDLTV